jgi:hypothetical protein
MPRYGQGGATAARNATVYARQPPYTSCNQRRDVNISWSTNFLVALPPQQPCGKVQQYGVDSFADPDYIRLYGMTPAEWHACGIRLLGRTAVECTRDPLGDRIGRDVASAATSLPPQTKFTVIDPFAGSCNTLYWILRLRRTRKSPTRRRSSSLMLSACPAPRRGGTLARFN